MLGARLVCPCDNPENPTHIAAVVKGRQGKTWLAIEASILSYEIRYTAVRWFGQWGGRLVGRHGVFLTAEAAALVLCLALARTPEVLGLQGTPAFIPRFAAAVAAVYAIVDTVIERTSVAFVSRFPTHPLRTMLISVLSFVHVGLSFAILYALNAADFTPRLDGRAAATGEL
jgi:hypothetical protein